MILILSTISEPTYLSIDSQLMECLFNYITYVRLVYFFDKIWCAYDRFSGFKFMEVTQSNATIDQERYIYKPTVNRTTWRSV